MWFPYQGRARLREGHAGSRQGRGYGPRPGYVVGRVRKAESRHDQVLIGLPKRSGLAIDARKSGATHNFELADGDLRDGTVCIGGYRLRLDGARHVEVEAAHAAVIPLGNRAGTLITPAQAQGQFPADLPVVLDVQRRNIGLVRVGVGNRETATAGNAVEQCCKALADWR